MPKALIFVKKNLRIDFDMESFREKVQVCTSAYSEHKYVFTGFLTPFCCHFSSAFFTGFGLQKKTITYLKKNIT
jgi:hypothetical protein